MDSLDSTVGTVQREKIKQIRQKQIDVPVSEDISTLVDFLILDQSNFLRLS